MELVNITGLSPLMWMNGELWGDGVRLSTFL